MARIEIADVTDGVPPALAAWQRRSLVRYDRQRQPDILTVDSARARFDNELASISDSESAMAGHEPDLQVAFAGERVIEGGTSS